MDKYEYKIKADEIKELITRGDYAQAAEIADGIDWRRVKSVMMLCTISDLYKINKRYEDAKNLLLLAYDRRPGGKTICYSLCELCLKTNELGRAATYYTEYVQAAPTDPGRYILQYKLYEAQGVNLEERIEVLEELKMRDYREKWAYELAYLYHQTGQATKCVDECDELILWFGEGKYVWKAMELKEMYEPLTTSQQEKYDHRNDEPAPVEEKEPAAAEGEAAEASDEGAEAAASAEGAEEGKEEAEPAAKAEAASEKKEDDGMDIEVKPMDFNQYNTINLQAALAEGLKEVLDKEKEKAEAEGDVAESTGQTESMAAQMAAALAADEAAEEDKAAEEKAAEEKAAVPADTAKVPVAEVAAKADADKDEAGYLSDATRVYDASKVLEALGEAAPAKSAADASSLLGHETVSDATMIMPKVFPDEVSSGAMAEIVYTDNGPAKVVEEKEKPAETEKKEEKEAETYGFVAGADPAVAAALIMGQMKMEAFAKAQSAQPPKEIAGVLSQEADGQISLVMPEGRRALEEQITGQISIDDVLVEWEKIKKESEEKRKEEVRQHVLEHTGAMFTDFEASVRDGLLEQIERGKAVGVAAADPDPEDDDADGDSVDYDEIGDDEAEAAAQGAEKKDEEAAPKAEMKEIFAEGEGEAEAEEGDEAAEGEKAEGEAGEAGEDDEAAEEKKPEEEAAKAEEEAGEAEEGSDEAGEAKPAEEKAEEEKAAAVKTGEAAYEEYGEAEEFAEIDEEGADADEAAEGEEDGEDDEASEEKKPEEEAAESDEAAEEKKPEEEAAEAEAKEADDEEADEAEEGSDEAGEADGEAEAAEGESEAKPVERERTRVRALTAEEKELFGQFIQNRTDRERLVKAIDNISMAAYIGNIIITGDEGMDTLTLAKNMIREVQMTDSNFSGKVAKISGRGMNNKDVAETLERLKYGALIIQKASELNETTVQNLYKALQQDYFGIIVVIEDTKRSMQRLLKTYPELLEVFTARMDVEALSNDTLAEIAKKYAREREYSIDEFGIMALHARISEMQTSDHNVTVAEVKEIIDEAIESADRKTIGHFFDILFGKRYDDEDMIILTEKDFI